ncbi:MAG TPA: hypothetical protein PLA94_23890, partial [Myxococcota bacterium]|nr:hypothetical protein [Myxococcota bacterium]
MRVEGAHPSALPSSETGGGREDVWLSGGPTIEISYPDSLLHVQPVRKKFEIDLCELIEHSLSPEKYGEILTVAVFRDSALRAAFEQWVVRSKEERKSIRICIEASGTWAELWWDTLRHPGTGESLAVTENYPLSRYTAWDSQSAPLR